MTVNTSSELRRARSDTAWTQLKRAAIAATRDYINAVDRVNGDKNLSGQGKQAAAQEARQRYNATMADLTPKVDNLVKAAATALEAERNVTRQHAADKRRALLGDMVTFAILERKIAAADDDGALLDLVSEAADDWTMTALSELLPLELKRRKVDPMAIGDIRVRTQLTAAVDALTPATDDGLSKEVDQVAAMRREAITLNPIARAESGGYLGVSADQLARTYANELIASEG